MVVGKVERLLYMECMAVVADMVSGLLIQMLSSAVEAVVTDTELLVCMVVTVCVS